MKALEILKSELKNNSWTHAYLLIGQSKKEIEELIQFIIKEREILPFDISRIYPEEGIGKSGEIKVDQIRELLRDISTSPLGKLRLAVIYNCDKLNSSSGNILLKSLEEPAGPVVFILVAEKESVLSTIKSRCRIINVRADEEAKNQSPKYIPELKEGFFSSSTLIEKVVKNGEIRELLEELENDQRQKMLQSKKPIYAEAIREIEEAKKKIKQNANPRLTLECLVMKLGKNI